MQIMAWFAPFVSSWPTADAFPNNVHTGRRSLLDIKRTTQKGFHAISFSARRSVCGVRGSCYEHPEYCRGIITLQPVTSYDSMKSMNLSDLVRNSTCREQGKLWNISRLHTRDVSQTAQSCTAPATLFFVPKLAEVGAMEPSGSFWKTASHQNTPTNIFNQRSPPPPITRLVGKENYHFVGSYSKLRLKHVFKIRRCYRIVFTNLEPSILKELY
jgi:hypothetical protein